MKFQRHQEQRPVEILQDRDSIAAQSEAIKDREVQLASEKPDERERQLSGTSWKVSPSRILQRATSSTLHKLEPKKAKEGARIAIFRSQTCIQS